jgi:hypothetical protein
VQQDHPSAVDAENHPRNHVAVEIAAHLPQAVAERRTMRTADRASEFDFLYVLSDRSPNPRRSVPKATPGPDPSGRVDIEPGWKLFPAIDHCQPVRQKWHNFASDI